MKSKSLQQVLLLLLAIVFSIALMFSFTELPLLLDSLIGDHINFPGLDHGRDEMSAYKTNIFIDNLYLRWIGYGSLILVIAFIALGFLTKKTVWAWAGAFTIFLPVFGQFAISMFFLAGLGMLRVGWLPFWDISFQVLDLGNVIYVPYWILMWIFSLFNFWATPLLAWFFMSTGAFLFSWGVLAWMQSRFINKGVATSWIYKFSRHPQYLGWIIWSYGLVIYTPLVNQMKKSWGIQSSLPWLLMTMIIIGICMLEEIKMKDRYGDSYENYRNKTPFLFPLPGWLKKILKAPMRLITKKTRPDKKREVVSIISIYTIIFMALSLFWVDLGTPKLFPLFGENREQAINEIVDELNGDIASRQRWYRFKDLAEYGDMAVPPMIEFLKSDIPLNQENATELLGEMGDTSAIRHLYKMMNHEWEDIRVKSYRSLVKLGDPNALNILLDRLQYENKGYPRSVIYNQLGKIGSEKSWDMLVDGSQNNDGWVRMAAVRAMAKINPDKTIPYLIPLFENESAWVRSDAATIAYKIKCRECREYLEKLADDENYEVRFIAKQAVKKLHDLED